MLGPIGPLVGNLLRRRGYSISRPTRIEKEFIRSPWRVLFGKDPRGFAAVYQRNRETLSEVPQWIEAEVLEKSLWRYGIPAEWDAHQTQQDRTGLTDIEPEVTASDVLGLVARQLNPLSYLEIGVSVGKNLLQISNLVCNAKLTGLDLEELNPTLLRYFEESGPIWRDSKTYRVETLDKKGADKCSSLLKLRSRTNNGNTLDYLSADQFRGDTWSKLSGCKFNLILSDGVHSGDALRSELGFLLQYQLIEPGRPFVMFWDDLWDIEMQSAFLESARALSSIFGVGDEGISMFMLHGSYGLKRPMGMFRFLPEL